jgi:hypothetical protein
MPAAPPESSAATGASGDAPLGRPGDRGGDAVSDRNVPGWTLIDRFAELRSRWVTLIGEHLRDDRGTLLEYWRVERASSVIVLPLHRGRLLLPPPVWRPGAGRATLDFPGGRLPDGADPAVHATSVLVRELGVDGAAVANLLPLTPPEGWAVDSSFSNQRVHGMLATLHDDAEVPPDRIGLEVPADADGVEGLLGRLDCLQCRALLLEWRRVAPR